MDRRPGQPGQPDEPGVPNTSRSDPSSHVEPERFLRNHTPVVWWILGALALFVIVGAAISFAIFVNDEGETGERAGAPGARVRPGESSAVAAQPAPDDVRVTDTAFTPESVAVPRGGSVQLVAEGADCRLELNGDAQVTLRAGSDYRFNADRAGEYVFACEGDGRTVRVTVL